MTAPRTPNDDRDLRQLTGAFDRPIAPSPRFADALKQRLTEEESTMQQALPASSRPVSNRTARAMSALPLTRRRWLEIAIAAVLIVGMLGGSFWYADVRIGNDPTGPDATRYAAQPLSAVSTPEANNPIVQTNDPGNTRSYPGGFVPDADFDAAPLPGIPAGAVPFVVSGNTLIVTGAPPDGSDLSADALTAVDLTSGAVLWTTDITSLGDIYVHGSRIIGVFSLNGLFEYKMTSISLETGAIDWSGETLFNGNPKSPQDITFPLVALRPVVLGDAIYHGNRDNSITALDAATGDVLWNLPIPQTTSQSGTAIPNTIVGEGDFLYAVGEHNAIQKIDRHEGTVVARFPLDARSVTDYVPTLHLKGNQLLIIARSRGDDVSHVDMLSTNDGSVIWSHSLGAPSPLITMTTDSVAIPHNVSRSQTEYVSGDIMSPGNYVSLFDLPSGEPVSLYGPSDSDPSVPYVSASSSGSVICINEGTLISCVDTASADRTLVTLPYAPGEGSFAPLLYWNDTAIVLDMDNGVTLVRPVEAPQHASVNELSGDPGNTSHFSPGFDITAPLAAEPLGNNPPHATGGIIVGDVLVGERTSIANLDPATFSTNGLYAHDLTTGEVMWRNTEPFYTRYTADASGVYGLTHPVSNRQRLVALDLLTGAERWRSEPLTSWSDYPENAPTLPADTPLAMEGNVYVPFTDGSVVAFDGETGTVQWEHEPESVPDIEENRSGASIVGDDRYLYASDAANTITVLDRHTGELIRQFTPEDLAGDRFWATLHLQGERLVILGRNMSEGKPEGRIAVLDAATGEALWSVETGTVQSNVLVTPNIIGVVHVEFDTVNPVERLLGEETTGDIHFSLFDIETGEPILVPEGVLSPVDGVWQAALVSSGDTICVSYITVTCFDLNGTVSPVAGFETPHITTVGQQLLVWDGNLIILDARESTHVVESTDVPVATPTATP